MGLTPLDAEKFEFQSGFRGYDRNQVEQFRLMVVQALEGHIQEKKQLEQRIASLKERLEGFQGNEELIRNSMVLAQKTGEDVVANAREEAGMIKARAEADCQEIRNELARLKAEREEFEYSFHGLLSGFLRRLEQGNPRLSGQAQSAPPPAAREDSAGEMMALLSEGLDRLDEPEQEGAGSTVHEAPPAPPAAAPQAPRRRSLEMDLNERDADHSDFSSALDSAGSTPAPPPLQEPEPLPDPDDEPEAMPPFQAPDRDMDEDLDISAELDAIGEQGQTETVEDWHEHGSQQPPAAQREIPGLEEVEGLRPPPQPGTGTAGEAEATEDIPAQPFTQYEGASRLQQSRPGDAVQPVAGSDDGLPPSVLGHAAEEREDGDDKRLPASNLDQVFGVPSSQLPEDDEEEEPYRPDW